MNNQCKFKVGDKVKRKDGKLFTNGDKVATVNCTLFLCGHYYVKTSNRDVYLNEDDLDLSDVTLFTKSDLKDGMVVTLREGTKHFILNRCLYKQGAGQNQICWFGIDKNYTSCLFHKRHHTPSGKDIMKVTYMGEVLWEREEESAEQKRIKELEEGIAKMQEELNKLL